MVISLLSMVGLSAMQATSASAVANAHIWNDSNSSNLCLAASQNLRGVPAIMWNCDAEGGQMWNTGGSGTNTFTITDASYNSCLDISGDSGSAGAWVYADDCSHNSIYWSADSKGGGYYEIINALTNQCLSVAGGSTAEGAHVIQWPCHGTADQLWYSPTGWNQ